MAMTHVEGQEKLSDQVYFIPSPADGTTKCLIIAHGGKLHGDGTFSVPGGLTIKFAAPSGKALQTSSRTAIMAQSFNQSVCGPGALCPDYSLAKFIGHPERMDYVGLRALQEEQLDANHTCPHIVTIAHRSFFKGYSKLVKLSEVAALVHQRDKTIDRLLVNACRGETDSILALMKATLFGA